MGFSRVFGAGVAMSYPNYPGAPGYPGSYPHPVQQQPGLPYPPQQQSGYPPQPGFTVAYPSPSQATYPTYPQAPFHQPPPVHYPTAPIAQPSVIPSPEYPINQGYPHPSGYPNPVNQGYPHQGLPNQGLPSQGFPSQSYPNQVYPNPGYPIYPAPGAMSEKPVMEQFLPSVYPHQTFDPRADAEGLYRSMKGLGTDEKGLINILCKRTASQRVQITQTFKALYGKDLESKIKSETSGHFEKVLVALTQSRAEFLACELFKAMDGLGTKESTLIEVLCTSTNQEIRDINLAYLRLFGKPLEKDIRNDTSGSFKNLLVSLAQGLREETAVVDQRKVKEDAAKLYHAGEAKLGTDESTFNSILATRSWPHLKQLLIEYRAVTGNSLEKAICAEFSFYVEKGLLGILQCAENRSAYFAKRLYNSMKGLGTEDSTLRRILVSRCDVDLGSIKLEYQKIYGKSLQNDVAGYEIHGNQWILWPMIQGIQATETSIYNPMNPQLSTYVY